MGVEFSGLLPAGFGSLLFERLASHVGVEIAVLALAIVDDPRRVVAHPPLDEITVAFDVDECLGVVECLVVTRCELTGDDLRLLLLKAELLGDAGPHLAEVAPNRDRALLRDDLRCSGIEVLAGLRNEVEHESGVPTGANHRLKLVGLCGVTEQVVSLVDDHVHMAFRLFRELVGMARNQGHHHALRGGRIVLEFIHVEVDHTIVHIRLRLAGEIVVGLTGLKLLEPVH